MIHHRPTPTPLVAAFAALATLSCVLGASASPPIPRGAPVDKVAIGDAFVKAWLAFRKDLETISHGNLNPDLLDAWFDQAPQFLLRDASRLATAPTVVSGSLRRLRLSREDQDLPLFEEILAEYRGTPVGHEIWGALISAGHRASIRSAHAMLNDPSGGKRIAAARALAAAAERHGLQELSAMLSEEPHLSNLAALTLGEVGGREERRALRSALDRDGDFDAARIALGEMDLRERFGTHHKMLVRRDPLGQRFESSQSLYGVWFTAIGAALEAGAKGSSGVFSSIEEQRKAAPGDDSGEVIRRQLKSLLDFWERTDAAIRSTAGSPSWPANYDDAIARITQLDPRDPLPSDLANRVSAAISIIAWAGARLDHEALFERGIPYSAITPRGDRMADFNFATSWRGIQGEAVIVDLEEPVEVRSIDIAQSCDESARGWIGSVSIRGDGEEGTWEIERDISPEGLYFRSINVGGRAAARLRITLRSVRGDLPACVGELRIR